MKNCQKKKNHKKRKNPNRKKNDLFDFPVKIIFVSKKKRINKISKNEKNWEK